MYIVHRSDRQEVESAVATVFGLDPAAAHGLASGVIIVESDLGEQANVDAERHLRAAVESAPTKWIVFSQLARYYELRGDCSPVDLADLATDWGDVLDAAHRLVDAGGWSCREPLLSGLVVHPDDTLILGRLMTQSSWQESIQVVLRRYAFERARWRRAGSSALSDTARQLLHTMMDAGVIEAAVELVEALGPTLQHSTFGSVAEPGITSLPRADTGIRGPRDLALRLELAAAYLAVGNVERGRRGDDGIWLVETLGYWIT